MSRVTTIAQSTATTSSKELKPALIARIEAKIKAEKQAKKIILAIKEVATKQHDKKSSKSFDDFLNEL